MRTLRLRTLLYLTVIATLASPEDAWAYIDPGAGSYLFQLAIAGGLAGVYTLRRYWDAIKSWLTRNTPDK